jgi:hypothetical protein
MLSNTGICVSGRTVERLKVQIFEDTICLAELVHYALYSGSGLLKAKAKAKERDDILYLDKWLNAT